MNIIKKKRIDVTITIGQGNFGEAGKTSKTFSGHRVSAQLVSNGLESVATCTARIYGMSLDDMNQLTTIGPVNQVAFQNNTIQIAAGDDGEALTSTFFGTIYSAQGNLQGSPDAFLDVYATIGGLSAVKPFPPNSWRGDTAVSDIMAWYADEAGFGFENQGVSKTLYNPYFYGSTLEKMRECCRSSGIYQRNENGIIIIWEDKSAPPEKDIIRISPDNGLINYPIFSQSGIVLKSVFNPTFNLGKIMVVSGSEISQANGPWRVNGVNHSIESETPGGEWFTNVQGYLYQATLPITAFAKSH